jgi:hypothetical protein
MGLGKALSTQGGRQSTGGLGSLGVANVAQGGFVNIGADTKAIEKKFADLLKAVGDEKEQLKIHRKVAKISRQAMRNEVKDSPVTVRLRSGKTKRSKLAYRRDDIEPGTLKRSIVAWKIRHETSMWVGPRANGKLDRKDGWFAGIVESGLQNYGPGRNKGAITRGKMKSQGPSLAALEKEYKKVIAKAAKK